MAASLAPLNVVALPTITTPSSSSEFSVKRLHRTVQVLLPLVVDSLIPTNAFTTLYISILYMNALLQGFQ